MQGDFGGALMFTRLGQRVHYGPQRLHLAIRVNDRIGQGGLGGLGDLGGALMFTRPDQRTDQGAQRSCLIAGVVPFIGLGVRGGLQSGLGDLDAEPVKLNETSGGWFYLTGLLGLDGGAGLVDPHLGGQGRGCRAPAAEPVRAGGEGVV